MAVSAAVQEFLRTSNVPYSVFQHAPAYTARQEAAVAHVPGRDWAKTVIRFADGEPIQAVVPANCCVNLDALLRMTGAAVIRVARIDELNWLFPDCEPGGMPPFGPLYHQRVFVDEALAAEDQLVFNAGTHTDAVRMRYEDFATVTRPVVGRFAQTAA